MNIKIGPPVSAENFFPRPELITRLLHALEGAHVAFLGPRRTGKTSCLKHIVANPPTGYIPIRLNLENHSSVESWLVEMLEKVAQELNKPGPKAPWILEKSAAFLKRIEELTIMGQGIKLGSAKNTEALWRPLATKLTQVLLEENPPILFLLDEFPVFLNLIAKGKSADEVESLLNWFRATRQDLVDHAPRFLVTGSIGLTGVVRRLGLSPTINDFDMIEIPPLTNTEALAFLKTLAGDNQIPTTQANRREIPRLLGAGWPILLQLFVSEIKELNLKKSPSKKDLERIYRENLIAGPRNKYCEGMFTRLKESFSSTECRLAREILKTTCRSQTGLPRTAFEEIHTRLVPIPAQRELQADELDYVLDALKHDGYLLQSFDGEQLTQFASNILRDFWQRKTS